MTPELREIEQKRRALKVSRGDLEREAGISPNYLSMVLAGRYRLRSETIARLHAALNAIARKRRTPDDYPLHVVYRLAVVAAAQALGCDPVAAQDADPARRATQDPTWMAAASARRLALYLLSAECGIRQAAVARAAGLTRQAVSEACRAVEDLRDDGSALDATIDTLKLWIMGEPA